VDREDVHATKSWIGMQYRRMRLILSRSAYSLQQSSTVDGLYMPARKSDFYSNGSYATTTYEPAAEPALLELPTLAMVMAPARPNKGKRYVK
jgi:hypothetical protein